MSVKIIFVNIYGLCTARQPKVVVHSGTAFPSTFVPSTLFPQVRVKQYAGLHVDTL